MPNALVHETSPYLRQHADNPVAWLPWGEAALAKARNEGKPIFLSIGYSTCHWCHVMAHESFESEAVAAVLNRDFVPVKVDREERPDLDRVYMTYVQHTTGHGGWPMSVWLTPEGKPFYGGTYFPREDRHGRPGFISLLNLIAGHWRDQRPKIEAGAEEVLQALRRYAVEGGPREERPPGEPVPLHEAAGEAFEKGFQYFYESFDGRWGGFGGAPKFPRASVIDFLLRTAALQGTATDLGQEAIRLVAHTLQRMAEGGLHDHLGGGFHRYAVDDEWHVPHFEKMLYDQAQIALNLLAARQATGIETYAWVARGIFDYVARDLTGPHGAFYSAEDADSLLEAGRPEHAEGAFYVWTQAEIEAALGADAAFFCAHFDVKPEGNVAHDPHGEFGGKNVLRQLRSLTHTADRFGLPLPDAEQKLLAGLERLRAIRAQRPRPHRDEKVVTAWNGLTISALAKAAVQLQEPSRLAAAGRAAEFIQRELWDPAAGRLYRTWLGRRSPVEGFAEDYACLIQGLLDLYEAGFDIRWLQWAEQLQQVMDGCFWDAEAGGYFNSPAGADDVLVRLKDDHDGAEPTATSVAVANLVRLEWMTGLPGGVERARRAAEAMRRQWERVPHAMPQLLAALEWVLAEPRSLVLAGDPGSASFHALQRAGAGGLGPCRVTVAADGGPGQAWLAVRRSYLAQMGAVRGMPAAYLCDRHACQAPVTDAAELDRLLRS